MAGIDLAARARLRRSSVMLGVPGLAGLALLLLCVPAASWWIPAARTAAQDMADAAEAARRKTLRGTTAVSDAHRGPESFGQSFPDVATRTARLNALLSAAERHGVQIRRSEYRYAVDTGLSLGGYRVVLPAQASYAALQAFIADAMRRDGALALERLSIVREKADGGALRAELAFTLYVHERVPATGKSMEARR